MSIVVKWHMPEDGTNGGWLMSGVIVLSIHSPQTTGQFSLSQHAPNSDNHVRKVGNVGVNASHK